MENLQVSLTLTIAELNQVLDALGDKPYKQSAAMIQKLGQIGQKRVNEEQERLAKVDQPPLATARSAPLKPDQGMPARDEPVQVTSSKLSDEDRPERATIQERSRVRP